MLPIRTKITRAFAPQILVFVSDANAIQISLKDLELQHTDMTTLICVHFVQFVQITHTNLVQRPTGYPSHTDDCSVLPQYALGCRHASSFMRCTGTQTGDATVRHSYHLPALCYVRNVYANVILKVGCRDNLVI